MNIWHDIDPARITPHDFIAVVEIPKGCKNKYELDKSTGMLILDRVLYTSTRYPANYGFIPRTYADDLDPLDVLVLSSEPIDPLTLVRCYPIGMIKMTDNDASDEKIIAVPFGEPTYNEHKDIYSLPKHMHDEMANFFTIYKTLENRHTAVQEVLSAEAAVATIIKAQESYNKIYGQK